MSDTVNTELAVADVVLFDELATDNGQLIGVATLNSSATLNALSVPMIRLLTPRLRRWASDPRIVAVILRGAGEKGFCAGGDIRDLYDSIRRYGPAVNPYANGFFAMEYELDYLIHVYRKPIVCWGHGIVMGGGIGLMAGASHRIVTQNSRLAMPEIGIGLYPDVGGSWLLRRMPGRVGLFLALTGAPLNAADAIFCGVADYHVESHRYDEVVAAMQGMNWGSDVRANRAALSRQLSLLSNRAGVDSRVRSAFDTINELMAGDDLTDIAARLQSFGGDDQWLIDAAASFRRGSPTSASLAFELWNRVVRLSLADVFRLEYWASLGCCAHSDFAEGVRALLIDKDRKPVWQPATLAEVSPAIIEAHLQPRLAGPHPLDHLKDSLQFLYGDPEQ